MAYAGCNSDITFESGVLLINFLRNIVLFFVNITGGNFPEYIPCGNNKRDTLIKHIE